MLKQIAATLRELPAQIGGEGRTYHYDKPIRERAGNMVFRFWGRWIAIGMAFSIISAIASMITAGPPGVADEQPQEEARPHNPWAIDDNGDRP